MVGWNADNVAGSTGQGAVTLVEGSSFCISLQNGDIFPHHPHGVFHQDTRILSRWCLTINAQPVEPLGAWTPSPYQGTYIGRAVRADGRSDSPLTVERKREVGAGILEDITIHNYALIPATCEVTLSVDADFADLFEVKDGRFHRQWKRTRRFEGSSVRVEAVWQDVKKGVVIRAEGGEASTDGFLFHSVIPPHGEWSVRAVVAPMLADADPASPLLAANMDAVSSQGRRLQSWVASIPPVRIGNPSLERIVARSYADIGALRIVDPDNPDRMVVAAGAPWFMALFGRDSLLASFMVMPVNPPLALGTLQTLADRQGSKVDLLTEEQPGRILHEVRFGVGTALALGGKSAYYGTADATPLFVALLGEVSRWGVAPADIAALLPHADRALEWVRDYGDSDGDGFVEYERLNDHGLINQGWKDSWDGINFADGRIAEAPIALCEVQGYVYSAYIARAWMAHDAGDRALAAEFRERAERLKKQFNEQFWLPDRGYYAIALDKDKRPVDACASNMGHCLWSGIVDEDKALQVADRLMSPEMFSGWGVRTLATDMGAYNPVSYHNGSVWPHDNALIVAGLMRYGFVKVAQQLATALMEAAQYTDHRLPELFCGFSRSDCPEPLPYPTACSPQAWAATTPVMLIRSLLRHDAHFSLGGLWIDPVLPETWGDFHAENVAMGEARFSFDVWGSRVEVKGLPEGIVLHRGTRPSLADIAELDRLRRTN
ncbi:amylo-alpha-1,6-glucosidase [Pseudarthrobacter raffinosi]|uniref:amylo-alpha-1,6-glucosidase n=1 Tax=Pseudarthrobacter raffinosi TaxID=2953651 RepID=UPI00208FBD9D|nr:glycogen debranching N-terminal domain-containing protein [Pseudarthrobacter sp. MDT3-9]MCO4251222.1 amylo-alpha-1,6-glucosidase [Pseudarthrobacter sp. MDT3-9]